MICPICRQYYDRVEILDADPEPCPKCIDANYKAGLAMHRASRIHYNKELVVIGRAEFECSGYYLSGGLYDQQIILNGTRVYGLLSNYVNDRIENEIIRRVKSGAIVKRIQAIEKELPNSKDPATLRLERSELNGELEKIEEAAG